MWCSVLHHGVAECSAVRHGMEWCGLVMRGYLQMRVAGRPWKNPLSQLPAADGTPACPLTIASRTCPQLLQWRAHPLCLSCRR